MEKENFILVEKTIKELSEKAEDILQLNYNGNYDRTEKEIFNYELDRSDLSEQQRNAQIVAPEYYKNAARSIYFQEDDIYELVSKKIKEKIINGCKENIEKEVYEEVMNSKIRVIGSVQDRGDGTYMYNILQTEFKEENDYSKYSNNIERFIELLKKVTQKSSWRTDSDDVYIEKVSIIVEAYTFRNAETRVKKLIRKYIRNNLTYCLKNGKIIIPDEYLKKGEIGIEEWRKLKMSQNKNNSIEKKIISQTYKEKRENADLIMHKIQISISGSHNWSVPFLTVDGMYNKTRTKKLVSEILECKKKQKFLEMSDEEIVEKLRAYWVEELTKTINALKNKEITKEI